MAADSQTKTAPESVETLIATLKSDDAEARMHAWLSAGALGAPAIKPLTTLMAEGEMEPARAAKRAAWTIVRQAGRPGATNEKNAVVAELIGLCRTDTPRAVCIEAMWMLSELAGDDAVDTLAALLASEALREDARMTLQRIPGERSIRALQAALAGADEAFKPALAQSLRARGIDVPGIPCRKLVPTKATGVKSAGA